MADYDLSKAGQNRGTGAIGLLIAGAVVVLILVYAATRGGGGEGGVAPDVVAPATDAAPEAMPVITQ